MEAWMRRSIYVGIRQSLVELTEGEGDTYFNLNLATLTNYLRFHSLFPYAHTHQHQEFCLFP